MTENQTKSKNQTKAKLILDVIIFILFLVAMDPHSSGITVHEWLTTSALAALVTHLLLNWDWIAQITRRFIGKLGGTTRTNYILNWLLFIDGTVIMLSGFMISEAVLPTLGIQLPQNFAWRSIHDVSANLCLLLLGAHTALHWNWIVDAFKRYLIEPVSRVFAIKNEKDVTV